MSLAEFAQSANRFIFVFPATCAAEKLPKAKRHASPRADQAGPKPRAMEREYLKQEPGFAANSARLFLRRLGLSRLFWL